MINSEAPQPSALNDRQVRGRYCGASLRHGQQVQPVRELGLVFPLNYFVMRINLFYNGTAILCNRTCFLV